MHLTAPSFLTFLISLAVIIIGLAVQFGNAPIPVVARNLTYVYIAGYVILLLGVLLTGV